MSVNGYHMPIVPFYNHLSEFRFSYKSETEESEVNDLNVHHPKVAQPANLGENSSAPVTREVVFSHPTKRIFSSCARLDSTRIILFGMQSLDCAH